MMKKQDNELDQNGYSIIKGTSIEAFSEYVLCFGEVINTTEVKVKENPKAFVTSSKAIPFHTDHHAADYVAWFCREQASVGGETMLIDTTKILYQYSVDELEELKGIHFTEHTLFEGDVGSCPLLDMSFKNKWKIYYSFELHGNPKTHNPTLRKLENDISNLTAITIRLMPGDALIIDNRRMLHGRSQIQGNKHRHLTRYWIK